MITCVALFRGINVGGHHRLPMADLVSLLTDLGLYDVRTYIQSGNAVFRGPPEEPAALAARIATAVDVHHGFSPALVILSRDDLEAAMAANPYPEATAEPRTLHLTFLDAPPPAPDLAALEEVRAASERFRLLGRVFYLHAPDGIGRSRLAARIERALGVAGTARNWRTVAALATLVCEVDGA